MLPLLPGVVARAGAHGTRPAILDRTGTYTYEQLSRASARIAARLLDGRDDLDEARVAFLIAPGFEYVAVQWGIWRAGGIAVPLPMSHPPAELDYLIRDSSASIAIADAENAATLDSLASAARAKFSTTEAFITPQKGSDPFFREKWGLTPFLVCSEPADRRALIVYTSGTTGRPKGVVITHGNLTAQIESLIAAWEWTASDRTLLVLPLHHVHGILNIVCCALWSGAVLEMLPRFESEATWDRLASGELTVFSAVPTIYHRLIRSWEAAELHRQQSWSRGCRALRLMMSGSAALPRTVLERWHDISGHVLLERYGMTEVGMALANPLHGERRPGFVGQPLPGVSARLVDGELQLKGAGVFSEYWRQPESTREAFVDGWFRTGDSAVVQDGAYRLLGRSSVDILKTGGHKISALEIEEVLRSHPAIAECVVVGVEDEEWGQRVCCAAELRPTVSLELEELKKWASSRLAPYKIPKDLACVAQLPRNAMGKVVKPEVAALFARPARPTRPAS
ncbi:MAG: long-chain fatty acid--CoA ligase [Acidobacteria bacterium]|nr:MAG: long-chain fatty acid--CoA ligase [Acidobacteriota bacterium]